jgi:hypothetical protein
LFYITIDMLSRGLFWLVLLNAFSSLSFGNVSMMITAEMLYKMILSCKSTMLSIFVSVTARGIAVPNLSSLCIMDTYRVAHEVSFALERSATNETLDIFRAHMRLSAGRPET